MSEPVGNPPRDPEGSAQTLAQLYLEAEGSRSRRMVVRWARGGAWQALPAWRFHRHVIRVGLFLRERLGVKPGDRVLVASALRSERLVAEWAAVVVGAVAVGFDREANRDALSSDGVDFAPRVAFIEAAADAEPLLAACTTLVREAVVVFDEATTGAGTRPWAEVLDLGGTLDTAERAQGLRAQARALAPDMAAIGYRERKNGAAATIVTHAEIVRQLRSFWARSPAREGDSAYVVAGHSVVPVCLPLWAFVADGRTSTALGTPGQEVGEIGELRPLRVIVPSDGVRVPSIGEGSRGGRPVVDRLLDRLPRAAEFWGRVRPGGLGGARARGGICQVLRYDGTPVGEAYGNTKRRLQ